MPVHVICKSHKNSITTKKTMLRTVFFGTQWQVIPMRIVRTDRNSNSSEIYGCPDYLQVWRWFNQKWRRYPPDNSFSMISLWWICSVLKGSKWIVRSGPKSNSSDILWLSSLPASLTKILSKMKSVSSTNASFSVLGLIQFIDRKCLIY